MNRSGNPLLKRGKGLNENAQRASFSQGVCPENQTE